MKKLFLILTLILTFSLAFAQQETVDATWESIKQHGYPEWFSDAKLGIFIHWGLYSVPSFCGPESYGEWYYRGLMTGDSARIAFQKKNYGEDFEYKDFNNMFKAELFDADEWADLFNRSGAKYVVLVTKHHDGYCLWDSKYAPEWNSVTGGPHRDIVGELTEAVRAQGLKMGFYYSLPEWTNPKHIWMEDPNDSITNYVETHMIPQFKELISTYKPSLLFADGEWYNTAEQWHARELISWYYNLVGDEAIVNDRWGYGSDYGFRTPEYSAGITQTDRPWAECRGLGRSFGLNRAEPLENYISSDLLIRHFVKLVAAGGGMTLNVGPAADGQIPLLQQERLVQLGEWLKINGEAVYATRPYSKFYEEKDVVVERIDKEINFYWVRNSPDPSISCDNFSAVWTGYITPEFSEDYTFEVEVDDAATVKIDGKTIIDYNPDLANAPESNAQETEKYKITKGKILLKEGKKYPIVVTYYEKIHQASIKLFWQSQSQKREIVPEKALSVLAVYSCRQPYICYTAKDDDIYAVALDYPQEKLVLNIPKVKKNTEITMLGCDKILPWKYKNGQLIIDTGSIQYDDIKSTAAWSFKIKQTGN